MGFSYTSSNQQHAFLLAPSGTMMQDLGTLGGDASIALALNNFGDVVGYSFLSDGTERAFVWSQSEGMQDIGYSGKNFFADGINDSGEVVGYAGLSYETTNAVLWTRSGGLKDLGNLGLDSQASAINNAGDIVGFSDVSTGVQHAFLWTQTAGMQDINALIGVSRDRYTITHAVGINEKGQIAADAILGGQHIAVLLDPQPVPEPTTFAVFGLSLYGFLARRRR